MRRTRILAVTAALAVVPVAWLLSGALTNDTPLPSGPPVGTTPTPSDFAVSTDVDRAGLDSTGGPAVPRPDHPASGEAIRQLPQRNPLENRAVPPDATSVSHGAGGSLTVSDPTGLWYSPAADLPLSPVEVEGPNENAVVTCGGGDGRRFVLGTSFDGLWITLDGGATWTSMSENRQMRFMYRGAGFYEQIADCAIDGESGDVVFRLDFGNGTYRVTDDTIEQVYVVDPDSVGRVEALVSGRAADTEQELGFRQEAATARRARGRHGIYLAAAAAERFDSYLALLDRNRFDSVVVDFKDDLGRVTYDTTLQKPHSVGAVEPTLDVPDLVAAADRNDVYLIGRIVVFKDRPLYEADGYRYAVWNPSTDRPWGRYVTYADEATGQSRTVQVEHWVDPFSEEVWDYNIDIAIELQTLGVDEIQFDYIRFPSDGPTHQAEYRHATSASDRVDALAGFLAEARRRLSIPIGIDVFGFNAWFRTRYLGQDIRVLAEFVDVVSPMNYPSHFSREFLPEMGYFERSRFIYQHGSERAAKIVGPETVVRPYVQAFLIGPELEYDVTEYSDYLWEQLDGTLDSPADGFTLWNASGRYYMLTESVTDRVAPLLQAE